MARRRPAPQRVHQRPPAGRGGSSRRARGDWLNSWGTFISAIAAAIGLLVSGVATWAAVEALNEQRADARQEDELRAREQASQVSVWLEDDGSPFDGVVAVANYSVYPIERWGLYFLIDSDPARDRESWNGSPTSIGIGKSIPPCTRALIDLTKFRRGVDLNDSSLDPSRKINARGIVFMDAQGEEWHRGITDEFSEIEPGLRSGWVGDSAESRAISFESERLTGCSR
ncbi:hypothetical protein GCM10009577_77530 [Streptomyces javensis]